MIPPGPVAARLTLWRKATVALCVLLLQGCAGAYFRDAGAPPSPAPRYELAAWPYSEYWTGVIFNGQKIGFTHFTLGPAPGEPGKFEIRSEAAILLKFLGIEKKVNLRSRDVVNGDLTLARLDYDYNLDGSALRIAGNVDSGTLRVTLTTAGRDTPQTHALRQKIYPASVIALYPVFQGLEVGRDHAYWIYDGESQTLAEVTQTVDAYQGSTLFEGNAHKITTRLHGFETTTWIGADTKPVFELGLSGVMISALEDEEVAKRYLAAASLNKQEALLEFSIVRTAAPIPDPRKVSALRVVLSGVDPRQPVPSDELQRCAKSGEDIVCEIRQAARNAERSPSPEAAARYRLPSMTVQSNDPSIRRLAGSIVAEATDATQKAQRFMDWMNRNIKKEAVDAFSSLDVLESGRAECQGHSYLFAALARSVGIATRIVNGLVYSDDYGGFLYHTWVETLLGGAWIPMDPTFGQELADATHIKLLEGENLAELFPLLDWVGKLKISVVEVKHGER